MTTATTNPKAVEETLAHCNEVFERMKRVERERGTMPVKGSKFKVQSQTQRGEAAVGAGHACLPPSDRLL